LLFDLHPKEHRNELFGRDSELEYLLEQLLGYNNRPIQTCSWVFLGIVPIHIAQSYSDCELLSYFEYG